MAFIQQCPDFNDFFRFYYVKKCLKSRFCNKMGQFEICFVTNDIQYAASDSLVIFWPTR